MELCFKIWFVNYTFVFREEKKVEKKEETKVYDWKKSVKKTEKKEPVKEESKPEKVQLKKPKVIEKPKEEKPVDIQLKPTPSKPAREEEKAEGVKLKPIPQKEEVKCYNLLLYYFWLKYQHTPSFLFKYIWVIQDTGIIKLSMCCNFCTVYSFKHTISIFTL